MPITALNACCELRFLRQLTPDQLSTDEEARLARLERSFLRSGTGERAYERHRTFSPVRLRTAVAQSSEAVVVDVSMEGAWVVSEISPEVGAPVHLSVGDPGAGSRYDVACEVVRIDWDGLAVRFTSIHATRLLREEEADDSSDELSRYFRRMRRQDDWEN